MEVVFQKYYHRLCHFAWLMLKNDNLVQDIVQDAFITFWKNRDGLADDEVVHKNYLYSTVRNACLNALRHEKVIDKFIVQNHENPLYGQYDGQYILHNIVKAEVMVEILRLVENLPVGCKNVFRLSYLEGLSNQKVAESLNISINTVKTQKQRGLKYLRSNLDSEYFTILIKLFVG